VKLSLSIFILSCLFLVSSTVSCSCGTASPTGEKKSDAAKPDAKAQTAKSVAKPGQPAEKEKKKPDYDWGVIYYMPYDNNLEQFGELIIDRIRQGVVSEKLVAAVQADFSDKGGMYRYTITSKDMKKTRLKSDDSADENRIMEYMNWFAKKFHCKNYIVVFLNHGGKLDETSLDLRHSPKGKRWASGRVLGGMFRKFKKDLPGNWPLLFLQQCGRGSLENLYSFRGTAEYIMSSPVPVGAPNTYYTDVIKWLSGKPDATGDAIAKKIAEEDDHYSLYTCLKTEKLDELPKRLDKILNRFLEKNELTRVRVPIIFRPEPWETITDAKALFQEMAKKNGTGKSEVDDFLKWLSDEFFTMVRFHGRARRFSSRLCGVSIYHPLSSKDIKRYSNLYLYKDGKLPELWRKLVSSPPGKKK